jgi:hypothetical protein
MTTGTTLAPGVSETATGPAKTEREGPETETETEGEAATTETEKSRTESGETEAGSEAGSSYRFSAGESYTFSMKGQDGSERSVSWTVTEVGGERVTVELRAESEDEVSAETITGTHDGIYDLEPTQPGGFVFALARNAREAAAGHSLDPGEEWTAQPAAGTPEGTGDEGSDTLTAAVTGTDTHAGIDCSIVEFRSGSVVGSEGCINEDYPFALEAVVYGEEGKSDGTVRFAVTLTDYSEDGGGLDTTGPTAGAEGTTAGNGTAGARTTCPSLTDAERTRYDEPESPFVATFEHPGSVAATATVNNDHSLTIQIDVGDFQFFNILPVQDVQGSASPTPAMRGELDGLEQYDELGYAGETLPVVEAAGTAAGSGNADDETRYYVKYPYYLVGLPYEGSAGKKYYRFQVQATVATTDGLEAPVCLDSYEEVAKGVLESLEPKPDTTVESAGV